MEANFLRPSFLCLTGSRILFSALLPMNSKAKLKLLGISTFITFMSSKSESLVYTGSHWWKVEIYILQEERGQLLGGLLVILYISFRELQSPTSNFQSSHKT